MVRMLSPLLSIVLLLSTSICSDAATKMVRMSDHAGVDVAQVVEAHRPSDVVFLGDTHDDSALHGKQLEIIRALFAKNPQLAIGLEMFTADSQQFLDDWTSGKMGEKEFAAAYARNWSYDWALYRDIFLFARDNRIPMVALNVPKPIIGKVVKQGAQALTEAEKEEVPPGPYSLNPRQAGYLRFIREQVFGRVPPRFPVANFEEAQALRNETMAARIATFQKRAPKRTVVVIAGTWHAIRSGVPECLKKYGSVNSAVLLPDLPEFAVLRPTAEEVDYLILRDE